MRMILVALFCVLVPVQVVRAGDTVRPGLEGMAWSRKPLTAGEAALVAAMKEPFLRGKDVSQALQAWFDGRLLDVQGKQAEAEARWLAGAGLLRDLRDLPPVQWGPMPSATFRQVGEFPLEAFPDVASEVVEWQVKGLKQYGVLLYPRERLAGVKYRLMLYCHGAASGVPNDFCNWLAYHLVRRGYVVIAPAMRGEPLFQEQVPIGGQLLVCEGEIENLDGEVDDCLAMVNAAWKLPYVKPDEFGVIGHSFGAGAGLLAAARAGQSARVVISYDAWLTNPQRYSWDRMRRGANNWLSWEDFCNQPVEKQLAGLKKRSIILQAEKLEAPLLLFIGGGYEGSVFHLSHADFCQRLRALGKTFSYEVIPRGDHNFVLRDGEPSRLALGHQVEFLQQHYPPELEAAPGGLAP